MKTALIILSLTIASCSFKKNNQIKKGHDELYSEPQAAKDFNDSLVKRIVIASTNDFHAHFSPLDITFNDDHVKGDQSIQIGGVDIIGSYFKILRSNYKNVLLLDSGDIFSSEDSDTEAVRNYYSSLKYDAMTVGLNDFNLKLPKNYPSSASYFQDFAKKSSIPLLVSNLYELKTARTVEWKGTQPYLLKDIDGIKLGIIGLIPDDIVSLTPVDNRIGLFVESMLQSTLRHARLLRSLGADIVIVITHQGIKCGEEMAEEMKLPLSKVNFDPHKNDSCEIKGDLGEYLKRLPPHLVDVIIGGRTQEKMINYYNDILLMSGYPDGKSFNYAELFVDTKNKKLLKEKTIAHQPVYFCREFFKETNDCYTEDASINHKERIPAKFLGEKVEVDTNLAKKFSSYLRPKTASAQKSDLWPSLVQKSIVTFGVDIAFFPQKNLSKNSQLMMVEIKGHEFFKILEADYNLNHSKNWLPSPFKLKNDTLNITIEGEAINSQKTYRIISDLEGLQGHPELKKLISKTESRPYITYSWNELARSEFDAIEIKVAAPTR